MIESLKIIKIKPLLFHWLIIFLKVTPTIIQAPADDRDVGIGPAQQGVAFPNEEDEAVIIDDSGVIQDPGVNTIEVDAVNAS